MNDQEIEHALDLLERYFEQASPDDATGNIRLIKQLAGMEFAELSGTLLMVAPGFIVDILRQLVQAQTTALLLIGGSEREMDFRLRAAGLEMVMEYAHLIQASGSGGVAAASALFPLFARSGEDDAIAILALALSFVLQDKSPLIQIALQSAIQAALLRPIYDQLYNTSARIALAYLLFERGQRDLFQREAVPMLARGPQRREVERLLKPGNMELRALVIGDILLDIASQGAAIRPEAGWKRRR